ncbi:MAG: hypothetical protein KA715_00730 [Xanthomonadaceae bacterium]|nr:hypothetical protein [Xanthomonadaceae bacterium]
MVIILIGLSACSSKKEKEPENTLHIATLEKIKGLDPAMAGDLYSGDEVARAYEGLLQYHYLKRPYTLVPMLAEAMPAVSEDRKTLTFKIRKGVLFQDDPCFKETNGKGRELVAEDFIYTFKRVADSKTLSEGWWIFDSRVVGLNEWRDEGIKAGKADYAKAVEGLKAEDKYTLKIKLKEPSSQFLYYLAMTFAYVVPHEAVEMYKDDFRRNPVGTGPFVFDRKESNLNSKLIWNKNPTFRKDFYPSEGAPGDKELGLLVDAGKQLPLTDRLVVTVFVEPQPMWLNFMTGKLEISGIPKDNFDQALGADKKLHPEFEQKKIMLHKEPELDITHESFNMSDPLFAKNKFLRQALSMAMNSAQVVDLFYNGRAIAAQGPIPPGLAGYDPALKNPYREFNIEKAKELLKKAGYPNGEGLPVIEYNTLSSSTYRQITEFVEKSFGLIGVKIKVNTYTWPEFIAALKNKKGQMWGYAWVADYPDAENFLQLFYSKNVSPGPNDSNYSNPEYDKLYESSLKLTDGPQRTALYQKMVKILVDDAPWIWAVHRIKFTLSQPWTKNYKLNQLEHSMMKYLRVDTALKK